MGFRPLNDRLTVKRDQVKQVSAGGIILTGPATKEMSNEGTVIAVGPGRMLNSGEVIATTVKAGDRIVFLAQAGHELKIDDDILTIINEGDVIAVIGE